MYVCLEERINIKLEEMARFPRMKMQDEQEKAFQEGTRKNLGM